MQLNPNNPRTIKTEDFNKLKNSIKNFPEMLEKRPIVYDENFIILGGNMRFRALQDLHNKGFEIKETYFVSAENWTDEQKKEFVIKDNIEMGDWDMDLLANEWSDLPLEDWGLDINLEPKEEKEPVIKDTFEVIIECENIIEQEEIFDKLSNEGYKCRVLTL